MEKLFICICCRRRYAREHAYITNDKIGICNACWEQIDKVPASSPFAGTDSTKMLIAPFYYTGALRSAVLQYKFQGKWLFGEIFAALMLSYIRDFPLEGQYDAIAGIPLSRKRLWERGVQSSPAAGGANRKSPGDAAFRQRYLPTEKYGRPEYAPRGCPIRKCPGRVYCQCAGGRK